MFSRSATILPERSPVATSSLTWPCWSRRTARCETQCFQAAHAAFVAGAACLHALADPHFFLRQELVELGVFDFFIVQQLVLARLVGREVARERQQTAAVEFDDAGGNVVQEAAVVGNEQDRAAEFAQQAFEPHDRREVEVVGRLVEQQHVRRRHQRHGQRHALLHTARQRAHQRVARQVQAVERGVDLVAPGSSRRWRRA